ncbi:hypothetical protein [Roseicella aerolata]|uniref:Uncharacterized protein n=1 Tax=Roseicella aerolata TaxID=2883479 RepID=A0A9X1LC39_9PROT|nr:hypothetical protein [Roseicella aerolata]MCB4823810.1 hypothetical protein [Roseicella aerolata]
MRIAVLGWGSLIWNPGTLKTSEAFTPTGPRLPVEFCRISNDGRLTLVLTEDFGTRSVTYSAVSAFGDLASAVADLRMREVTTRANIGIVDLRGDGGNAAKQRHASFVDQISEWAVEHHYGAVIWTALESNFAERSARGEAFSTAAAVRYLEELNADQRADALRYIRNAPSEVQTPVLLIATES